MTFSAITLFTLIGNQLTIGRNFDLEIRVKDEEIVSHARKVYEVFTGAFFLHSPCLTADISIRKTLEKMNDESLIQALMVI